MTKKRPFFERIVSMLLVAVMVIGLLPTSVLAQSGGEVDGETGSVSTGKFPVSYDTAYGAFTRFTLVKIDAPDCDSTNQGHEPDPSLNPSECVTGSEFKDINNYTVVVSINIGASSYPCRTDAVFYKTNALDYLKKSMSTSDASARKSDVVNYWKSSATASDGVYYHWKTWLEHYCKPGGWDTWVNKTGMSPYAWPQGDSSQLNTLMQTMGEMDYGGDTNTFWSGSPFLFFLLAYFCMFYPVFYTTTTTPRTASQESF